MKTVKGQKPGIDAVRDLIFGEHMKDYEIRFANLENEFKAKIHNMEKKLKDLEKAYKQVNNKLSISQDGKMDKSHLALLFKELSESVSEKVK